MSVKSPYCKKIYRYIRLATQQIYSGARTFGQLSFLQLPNIDVFKGDAQLYLSILQKLEYLLFSWKHERCSQLIVRSNIYFNDDFKMFTPTFRVTPATRLLRSCWETPDLLLSLLIKCWVSFPAFLYVYITGDWNRSLSLGPAPN